jgi:hypothetical protein
VLNYLWNKRIIHHQKKLDEFERIVDEIFEAKDDLERGKIYLKETGPFIDTLELTHKTIS